MTARIAVAVPREHQKENHELVSAYPTYWSEENHSASGGNTYLRAEEWLQDLKEFTLPVRNTAISITLAMGQSMMRYREELKMYAAIRDQSNGSESGNCTPSMDDVSFLEERHEVMKSEWPVGKDRAVWWQSLEDLRLLLDREIQTFPDGAFIKFSVRSPKDAAALVPSYLPLIREHVLSSNMHPDAEEALGADVSAVKYAAWRALRCDSGEDAMKLLLRSERIYIDILQHELFCKGQKQASFDLKVHIFEFFGGFDPDWEFRAFMCKGLRTAITIYNPWVYNTTMLSHKEAILRLLLDLWSQVESRIRSDNYSLDFAVAPDMSKAWIVELNNFLPPLAGCGVFNFYDAADRQILFDGPFEFRLKTAPVVEDDFLRMTVSTNEVDPVTKEPVVTRINMQPAPPPVMLYAANIRREMFGLPTLRSTCAGNGKKTLRCTVM